MVSLNLTHSWKHLGFKETKFPPGGKSWWKTSQQLHLALLADFTLDITCFLSLMEYFSWEYWEFCNPNMENCNVIKFTLILLNKKNLWIQSVCPLQVTAERQEPSIQVAGGSSLIASHLTAHTSCLQWHNSRHLIVKSCSLCKYLFIKTCPCKEAFPAYCKGIGTKWSQRFLPTQTILWFCDVQNNMKLLKVLRKCSVLWLRELVKGWLKSKSSHSVTAAALAL